MEAEFYLNYQGSTAIRLKDTDSEKTRMFCEWLDAFSQYYDFKVGKLLKNRNATLIILSMPAIKNHGCPLHRRMSLGSYYIAQCFNRSQHFWPAVIPDEITRQFVIDEAAEGFNVTPKNLNSSVLNLIAEDNFGVPGFVVYPWAFREA